MTHLAGEVAFDLFNDVVGFELALFDLFLADRQEPIPHFMIKQGLLGYGHVLDLLPQFLALPLGALQHVLLQLLSSRQLFLLLLLLNTKSLLVSFEPVVFDGFDGILVKGEVVGWFEFIVA